MPLTLDEKFFQDTIDIVNYPLNSPDSDPVELSGKRYSSALKLAEEWVDPDYKTKEEEKDPKSNSKEHSIIYVKEFLKKIDVRSLEKFAFDKEKVSLFFHYAANIKRVIDGPDTHGYDFHSYKSYKVHIYLLRFLADCKNKDLLNVRVPVQAVKDTLQASCHIVFTPSLNVKDDSESIFNIFRESSQTKEDMSRLTQSMIYSHCANGILMGPSSALFLMINPEALSKLRKINSGILPLEFKYVKLDKEAFVSLYINFCNDSCIHGAARSAKLKEESIRQFYFGDMFST